MLTVQEIQAMSFEKAVFGGYDPKSVDDFIEQITEDFAALQKESAALKAKMKVLVDKIEEYRSVEDGMRRALVSAQNIAQETIDKAKLESEQLLAQAQNEQTSRIQIYEAQIAAETQRLAQAKQQSADFLTKMTAYCEEQLKGLVAISASDALQMAELPQAPIIETITAPVSEPSDLEQTRDLSRDTPAEQTPEAKEYTIPEDIRKFMDEQQSSDGGLKVKVMEVTMNNDSDESESDAKPKFSFGELKFGADYSPENDK